MNRRHFTITAGAGAAATLSAAAMQDLLAKQSSSRAKGMFRSMNPGTIAVKGTFEETLNYARMGGFEGMDSSLSKMAGVAKESGVAHIKARYEEAGLRVGGMSLPQEWRGKDSEFEALIAQLPGMAAIAQQLGASGCMTYLSPLSPDLRFRENFHFHISRLRPIAEILKNYGLRLGIEPVGPRTKREEVGYGFIYTSYGALGLAEAIDTGNVGLLLDSWHWYTAMGTGTDLASLTADEVVHVHINDAPADIPIEKQLDNRRALPGETGVIDLKTFLTALDEMGYCGPVTPEPMSPKLRAMTSAEAAKAAGDALKAVWDNAGL